MGMMIDLRAEAGPALIVGGGKVAARKAKSLAEAEFRIVVISPLIADSIRSLPWATLTEREFVATDLPETALYSLVFACTDSRAVNLEVGRLARAARIPVVVADRQAESTFFTPATLRDGDLAVAVSTGGASPGLASRIRQQIAAAIGPGWGNSVYAARRERDARLRRGPAPKDDV
ncbi:MAG: bifunctional precorrin-2 dehydrogenase/sirohydrochlorin ferrochelatase [Anaerolineaceae bacterium]